MKINKEQLKKIIKEEVEKVFSTQNNIDDTNNEVEIFKSKIKSIIIKHFPNSFIQLIDRNLSPNIIIRFAVGKDKSQWVNGILQNDVSFHVIQISGINKDETLNPSLTMTCDVGGSIIIKPSPGSHYAFEKIKVGWRNKKGSPNDILKALDIYFAKLKESIRQNANKIPEDKFNLIKDNI